MKIAYICSDPGIPVFGMKGASIHIQEVIRVLLNKGHDITLITQRVGGEVPKEFSSLAIHALPKLNSKEPKARAKQSMDNNQCITQLLNEEGPFDLIYERYSLWSDAGIIYGSDNSIASILEVNAPLIEEQKCYRELPFEAEAKRILTTILKHANTVSAVSPGVKSYLDKFLNTEGKVHIIPNGVDINRFCALTNEALRGDATEKKVASTFSIGFVGTLKPWHGTSVLLEAFNLVRQLGYAVDLKIVGDGPEKANLLQRINELELSDFVTMYGAVDPQSIPSILNQFDIGVAPYPDLADFYFSPLKVYEYMAAGLPVVTTKVGHLDTVIIEEETGLLVKPDNAQEMSEAIIRLINDENLRHRLGQSGRDCVASSHTWVSVVDELLTLSGK